MKRNVIAILLAVLSLSVGGCQTNPATGRSNFNVLTESEEISIGQDAAPQFLAEYGGPIPSPQVTNYVSALGRRLAQQSERADLPWEFFAVDSSVINAFALPGGKVFITRGLMEKMSSEAELAGVLGHEIGHVTAQHIGQQMSRQMAIQAGLVAIGVGAQYSNNDWVQVLGAGAAVGGQLYSLSFSREQETEADVLGVRYMTRLGYNPVGQVRVMEVLGAAGGGGGIEFLQTHPYPETRIENLNRIIQQQYPDHNDTSKYNFRADEYRASALQPLSKLPPAKHKG
ncbi:MAG: M48 family metallopeptidase [Phycisphaeraceae bacterium]